MTIYIVIRLEKCELQMAKQPAKYIIIWCSFFLVRELLIPKIPLYDLSERSGLYIILGGGNNRLLKPHQFLVNSSFSSF